MPSLTNRFIWLVLTLVGHSCIMSTFVGGTPPLASYYVPTVPDKAAVVADNVVAESAGSLIRVVSSPPGSGYDTGRCRFYKIPADSILFSVHFTENDGRSAGISLNFVGTKRFSLNGGKQRSTAEQAALQAALLRIETTFINPVTQRIRRGEPN